MLKKLSLLIGFTETEVKVIIFLVVTFTAGVIFKELFIDENTSELKNYDYSAEDSLFSQSQSDAKFLSYNAKEDAEKFDYKREVLDFKKRNFEDIKPSSIPGEKSLNINNAGVSELTSLPGIGAKTAEEIIRYRKAKGKFSRLEELLEIKGIGETKFFNIKKYIYIE